MQMLHYITLHCSLVLLNDINYLNVVKMVFLMLSLNYLKITHDVAVTVICISSLIVSSF